MTNAIALRARRGMTLIELIVGITIFAIVGAAFTKLMTVQGKFFDRQGMANAARNVSRSSLNRVISDFRMIDAGGGVVAATPTSLTLRIPFAIGVMCANANGGTHLSLLPVDSTTYEQARVKFYGYAWRNFQTGAYNYVEAGGTSLNTGTAAVCTGVNITMVPNGKTVLVQPALPAGGGLGTPVFLYTRVRYDFKASLAVPGKIGLYRTNISPNGAEDPEEIVAPFAPTAGWKFFTVNGGATPVVNPPANLADIRGLELHFDGTSEYIAPGQTSTENAPFQTAVFFKNRSN